MSTRMSQIPIIAALLLGLIALVAWLPGLAERDPGAEDAPPALAIQRAQSQDGLLFGAFTGVVEPERVHAGVFTDTLALPTPGPGSGGPPLDPSCFQLGLRLSTEGTRVTGFVDLQETLVFTTAHTIQATPVGATPGPGTPGPGAEPLDTGPALSGEIGVGQSLIVVSEKVDGMLGGEPIQRQLAFGGAITWEATEVRIEGRYYETIWGYHPRPITVVANVTLRQTIFPSVTFTPAPPTTTSTPAADTPTPGGPTLTPTPVPDTPTPGGPTLTPTPVPVTPTPGGPTLTPTVVSTPGEETATPGPSAEPTREAEDWIYLPSLEREAGG